jgi:hypothetical protein
MYEVMVHVEIKSGISYINQLTDNSSKVVLTRLGIHLFENKARGGGSSKFFIHTF